MASLRGFEPPTPRLGGVCSILLSYVDPLDCRYLLSLNIAKYNRSNLRMKV